MKIRVYTIGVGAAGNAPVTVPFPVVNPFTGQRETRRVTMRLPVDVGRDELLAALRRVHVLPIQSIWRSA